MTNLSRIVEMLAKQALGGSAATQSSQPQSGLGGILTSVLGQLGGNNQQSAQGGLGGILGSVLGQIGAGNSSSSRGSSGSGAKSLLIMVLPLILAWIQAQGGLDGALDKLRKTGFTGQVDDWGSTGEGENARVDPEQMQGLFDEKEIDDLAQQAQAPKQDIYQAISQVFPQIIDALTPQGEQTSKQEANADIQQMMNLVTGFLKK